MASIYELSSQYLSLMDQLEHRDIDDDDFSFQLELLNDSIEEKANNYAKIIRNMESDVEGIKAEKERLSERQTFLENTKDWLKQNLQKAMEATGKLKIKTQLFNFNIQNNAPAVKIADEKKFIEWAKTNDDSLLSYKEPEIKRKEVADRLKAGEIIEGAELVQGKSLRIR